MESVTGQSGHRAVGPEGAELTVLGTPGGSSCEGDFVTVAHLIPTERVCGPPLIGFLADRTALALALLAPSPPSWPGP
ncbi:hypothetical protein [Streptomyces sp. NBC_01446]|uniref:hypothetical protein n=1 Tax=Streptomyces sp. NBC_01446 TaxID=2903870 RepID=UPI00225A5BE8|nr:hypothetical protein [Streptomyces sp. NBC_01446]MCX4649520.1 hypothetical protein [Streptomyces sp. NBC_01446]